MEATGNAVKLEMSEAEKLEAVKEVVGHNDLNDVGYETLEDAFISTAESVVVVTSKRLDELRQAGFDDIANSLASLNKHLIAYDWGRENL
jgi:hypothetical protein